MKTIIKTFFVVAIFGTLLFLGQSARWYHLGTPRVEADEIRTEPIAITDSTLQKQHPQNHFYYYKIAVQYVYSRDNFPFKKIQTDTTKKEMLFI